MADDIIEQQTAPSGEQVQATEPTVQELIKEQMDFRLNGGTPPRANK